MKRNRRAIAAGLRASAAFFLVCGLFPGHAAGQSLSPGDIVVVDWLDGNARIWQVNPATGERKLFGDLTNHGPAGQWPTVTRARNLVVPGGGKLYVIGQSDDIDPTDPLAGLNGLNSYPFPFPRSTCGSLVAVDTKTGERVLVEDFGNPAQADPSLPTFLTLGAFPIAGITQSTNLLVVDSDSPTTFGIQNARLGGMWSVETAGATAGRRSLLSNFADSTQGPLGVAPFAIARDSSGRVFVLDKAAFDTGIKDCNQEVGSPPVGCGALFLIDPDGTRHLMTD